MMAGRYAHAKQFNQHRRELRILRTRLGRIIRDIRPQNRRRGAAGGSLLLAIIARRSDSLNPYDGHTLGGVIEY
jgi:hypothetical protein